MGLCQGCKACLLVGHQRYSVWVCWGVREGKSTRRAKGRSDLIVGDDGAEVLSMEVVQLPNEKVNVVRGEGIVFLQIIKSDKGESGREIPPEDMNGRARVLGGVNDMHHRGVKREGRGDMDLD